MELCAEAGLKITPAGSCFPYGKDPEDKNIRLCPSYPSTEDLFKSMNIFAVCQMIRASAEKLIMHPQTAVCSFRGMFASTIFSVNPKRC